jgi:hypothetical protein
MNWRTMTVATSSLRRHAGMAISQDRTGSTSPMSRATYWHFVTVVGFIHGTPLAGAGKRTLSADGATPG